MQTQQTKGKNLFKTSDEDGLKTVSLHVKWLQRAIDNLEKPKPDLVKLV